LARPVAITPAHRTDAFACGHPALDDWLKHTALKAEGRTARTYVVTDRRGRPCRRAVPPA
jgi:hypothetical protein